MKYCSKCGAECIEKAKFCPKCGEKFEETSTYSEQPVNKMNKSVIHKKSKKGLIIGISIGVVLIIAAVVIASILFTSGKKIKSSDEKIIEKTINEYVKAINNRDYEKALYMEYPQQLYEEWAESNGMSYEELMEELIENEFELDESFVKITCSVDSYKELSQSDLKKISENTSESLKDGIEKIYKVSCNTETYSDDGKIDKDHVILYIYSWNGDYFILQ